MSAWDFQKFLDQMERYRVQHDGRPSLALLRLRQAGGENWKDTLCQSDIIGIILLAGDDWCQMGK